MREGRCRMTYGGDGTAGAKGNYKKNHTKNYGHQPTRINTRMSLKHMLIQLYRASRSNIFKLSNVLITFVALVSL